LALGRKLRKKDDAKIPTLINELRDLKILDIAAGKEHMLALDSEHYVWV